MGGRRSISKEEYLQVVSEVEDPIDFVLYVVCLDDLNAGRWATEVAELRELVACPPLMALLFTGAGTQEQNRRAGRWARELVDNYTYCLRWLIDEANYTEYLGRADWHLMGIRGVVALAEWDKAGKITAEGKALVDALTGQTTGEA